MIQMVNESLCSTYGIHANRALRIEVKLRKIGSEESSEGDAADLTWLWLNSADSAQIHLGSSESGYYLWIESIRSLKKVVQIFFFFKQQNVNSKQQESDTGGLGGGSHSVKTIVVMNVRVCFPLCQAEMWLLMHVKWSHTGRLRAHHQQENEC